MFPKYLQIILDFTLDKQIKHIPIAFDIEGPLSYFNNSDNMLDNNSLHFMFTTHQLYILLYK